MCSESTYDECMQRMLFGESEGFAEVVAQIKAGDSLFLYNVNTKRLHGEFIAASNGERDIVNEAWKGKFPWQVRVGWKSDFLPITKESFEEIVQFRGGRYPQTVIGQDQIKKLRELFLVAKELPSSELEFRTKFPSDFRCEDGHYVKSKDEALICNWLFNRNVCHGYDRKIPRSDNLYCDFWIKTKKGSVYIEYWGMSDRKYLDRKETKQRIYKEQNLQLVELNPNDLKVLDDIFPRKLRPYLPDFEFE